MASDEQPSVVIRRATPDDSRTCGQICYEAFSAINAAHGFPSDFPSPEAPIGLLTMMFSSPSFYCVVAEWEGRIVGSNCMFEHSAIRGVGPITIDLKVQNLGIGRKLMQAVLDRARESGASGVRLVQATFHGRSLSLYTSLGFDTRELLACLQGKTRARSMPGCTVRSAKAEDVDACSGLSRQIHGFDRALELIEGIEHGTALVVERGGRITGYTTHLALFGHATAETNVDMEALLCSVDEFGGPGILVPTRNTTLFRWCLANGLRVVQPMTLMSAGLYQEPAGAWLPSVLF